MAKKLPHELINDAYNVVVYTDGASSPNPGPSGSSLHGYIYDLSELNTKTSDKPTGYTITDKGYYPGDLKESTETHHLVKPTYYIDGIYVHTAIVSNNIAEVQALIFALEEILRIDYLPINDILLLSDSMYAIGVFQKVHDTTDWKTQEVNNKEYYWLLDNLISKAKEVGITLHIDKVKGHDISLGNNIADRLAVGGRLLAANNKLIMNEFNIIDARQYWSSQLDRHPFLKYKQLYFLNTDRSVNPVYSIINYPALTELASKASEPMFGTYIPTKPIVEVEDAIAAFQAGTANQHILLGTIDMSALYKQSTSHYYNLYGTDIYTMHPKRPQLLALGELPIVYAVLPSGLPKKAMDMMGVHLHIVNEYRSPGDKAREYIDITDKFIKNDGKKLECILPNNIENLDVNITYNNKKVLVPLSFGTDLPDRNAIKKLEKNNIKVILVVEHETETMFNYYILIDDTSTGDISVWCNFYSNKVLLPKEKK